jgi:hypothetical protein
MAAGVREAIAPLVSYAEEHAYPAPGWAEALIKAHRQSWAAIGGTIANANPGNSVNWASFFTDFGPWVEPAEGGEISHLPWHHAVYKRSILLEYGPELETMLETESILHADLQARGYRLYLEPAARQSTSAFPCYLPTLGQCFMPPECGLQVAHRSQSGPFFGGCSISAACLSFHSCV